MLCVTPSIARTLPKPSLTCFLKYQDPNFIFLLFSWLVLGIFSYLLCISPSLARTVPKPSTLNEGEELLFETKVFCRPISSHGILGAPHKLKACISLFGSILLITSPHYRSERKDVTRDRVVFLGGLGLHLLLEVFVHF